jgi:hypothetical protein
MLVRSWLLVGTRTSCINLKRERFYVTNNQHATCTRMVSLCLVTFKRVARCVWYSSYWPMYFCTTAQYCMPPECHVSTAVQNVLGAGTNKNDGQWAMGLTFSVFCHKQYFSSFHQSQIPHTLFTIPGGYRYLNRF